MSDYREQTQRPATGNIGTPALAVRKDTAADLSGGSDQNLAMTQMDSFGCLRITEEGGAPTYYGTSQFACDGTASDIALLSGNAQTIVEIVGVVVSSTANASAQGDLSLVRRSSANTGGVAVSAAVAKADSRNPTPGSIPQHYTTHPSALGPEAGIIMAQRYLQQAPGSPVSIILFDLRPRLGTQAMRLNGVDEIVAVNAVALFGGTGNAWDITWIWKELPLTA